GAVLNRDNFWDGRANHNFNGQNPFGDTANTGVSIGNSSLASQADGPPNNGTEMSCAGRPFNGHQNDTGSLATKLLARSPLQHQLVDPTDSVLGRLSAAPNPGLLPCGTSPQCTYTDLIVAAFDPAIAADPLNNFSRIWGQAIQAYESTLIPDRTPMDLYL